MRKAHETLAYVLAQSDETSFLIYINGRIVPQDYVAALLERGIRILIYAGTDDWQCNWVADERWVDRLEWSGSEACAEEPRRLWVVHEKLRRKRRRMGN